MTEAVDWERMTIPGTLARAAPRAGRKGQAMRGFLRGVIWGGVTIGVGLAALSLPGSRFVASPAVAERGDVAVDSSG